MFEFMMNGGGGISLKKNINLERVLRDTNNKCTKKRLLADWNNAKGTKLHIETWWLVLLSFQNLNI